MCVFMCASAHASHFTNVCLNVCSKAKCKMIARERREEIDVGAYGKPPETHTQQQQL